MLRARIAGVFGLCALLLSFSVAVPRTFAQDAVLLPPDPAVLQDLLARTNALRARVGREPLVWNGALASAAQAQAEWLASTGRRGHFRPDGSRPSTRAAAAGYVAEWCCGENYYMSIDATPDMVWNFWRASPSHYVNLTHRRFVDVGLGMSSNGERHSYVMVFGDPPGPDTAPASPAAETNAQPVVSTSPESAPPPAPVTVSGGAHIVRAGETLGRIARQYGVTVNALAQANGITNINLVSIGQRLVIPSGTGAPPAPVPVASAEGSAPVEVSVPPVAPAGDAAPETTASGRVHTVQAGETLYRIAVRYGTSFQAIAALNGLADPTRIYVGQQLQIPGP